MIIVADELIPMHSSFRLFWNGANLAFYANDLHVCDIKVIRRMPYLHNPFNWTMLHFATFRTLKVLL